MTLRLYGVVRAGHEPKRARLIIWQDIAAVVADTPPRALTEADAAEQLDVLSAMVPAGPVLPLRFGTVAADEDAVVSDVLIPSARTLRERLDRLDGLAEMHVHLRFDEDQALRAVHCHVPPVLGMSQVVEAGRQVVERLEAWRRERADELLASAAAHALGWVRLPTSDPLEERRAFLFPLDRIAEIGGTWIGPLPAYNFLEGRKPSRWGW